MRTSLRLRYALAFVVAAAASQAAFARRQTAAPPAAGPDAGGVVLHVTVASAGGGAADGKYHRLEVRLTPVGNTEKELRGLRVRGREGYTASGVGVGARQQPAPARISAADLSKLRWIEGSWRGTGDVKNPFFERYRLDGDSALVVEGFEDETLAKVSDVTRFELKDGELGGGNEGSRWAVSELTEDSVTFAPVKGARNTFRWQREPDGNWKAILDWPAADGKPARRRVYKMERWPPQK